MYFNLAELSFSYATAVRDLTGAVALVRFRQSQAQIHAPLFVVAEILVGISVIDSRLTPATEEHARM